MISSLSFSNKNSSSPNSFRTKILGRTAAGNKFTLKDYCWTNHSRLNHMNGMKNSNEQLSLFGTNTDIYSTIPAIHVDEFDASQFNTDEVYIAAKAFANKLSADEAKNSVGGPGETSGALEEAADVANNTIQAAGAVASGNAIETSIELLRENATKTADDSLKSLEQYMNVIAGRNDADAIKRIAFGNQYQFPITNIGSIFNGKDAGFGDAVTYGSKTGAGEMLANKFKGGMSSFIGGFAENQAQSIDLENMSLNESLMAIPAAPKWQGAGDGRESISIEFPVFNRTAIDYVNNMQLILALGMGSMSAVQSVAGLPFGFADNITKAASAIAMPACVYDVHIPGVIKKFNCNLTAEVKSIGMLRTVDLTELPDAHVIKSFFKKSYAKTYSIIIPDIFIISLTFTTVFNHNVNALVDYYFGNKV